jgi:hypothetical protein
MNEETMEHALKNLESQLAELRIVLGGDLTGKSGVLQNQVRMITALFDEKEGVVPRLTAMERRELERTGWIKGAYFAWCITGIIIGYLVNHFVIK